jgi:hypothetical protein
MQAHTAVLASQAAELPVERQRRLAAERTAEVNGKALEAARAARKTATDELRALPLGDVLAALGMEEDPKERGSWKAGPKGARTHRIAVKDAKWFDHVAGKGRGGAIDLTQHVLETDFAGALAWLADRFGSGATASEYRHQAHAAAEKAVERATKKRAPFTPPTPDPEAWAQVRRHLVEDRAIPADIVEAAHKAGDIYAQTRPGSSGRPALRNAVFVQRDHKGRVTGAEIKGIVRTEGGNGRHWSGLALGSRKGRGAYRVGVELAHAAVVAVVESAIDAMSLLAEAQVWMRGVPIAIISTAGDGDPPPDLLAQVPADAERHASQDRNAAGDRQAARLGEGWTRVEPWPPHEDWSDVLVARVRGTVASPPPEMSSPDLVPEP